MKNLLISASILSADFANLADQIHQCESSGIDWIHIDVMDGHFTPNLSMGPFVVETCKRITALPLDVHLMIDNPEKFLDAFANAGASVLSVHVEGNQNIQRTLHRIRELGCRAGIVVNPGTPASAIEYLVPYADLILVMTVNPGYSGQKFIRENLKKIEEIHTLCQKWEVEPEIEVDGGITPENVADVRNAGANVFVTATAIFKDPDGIAAATNKFRHALR